ncbi:hypothetical protein BAUCODRAFT_122835 [Baudoinia panamericana UAMH 10762]|uniref:Multicopper oxidase n=1 Tax=Baudoinia panamericana (strain UAMH 10762) TaxID=717646 RepID=M2N8X0_BAUPA|nr:uncharacterized protein BAUCODRAFT_122835 [Baudoinia panamericana UAMH 10762]EMC95519.1 hypothetical protein BAUCODRAFT_122835 [Baudoinia panamericana UAMH 10762]
MKSLLALLFSTLLITAYAGPPPGAPSGPPSEHSWGHPQWKPRGSYGPPIAHNATFLPDHILHLTYENVSIGCQFRPSVLINGTPPAPGLRLRPGRTSWIRPSLATAPTATQWPIPPLHFLDYEVHPLINDFGTYFYHSHVGFQAVSATGPLIVEDRGVPPYAYDEERVVQFTDYFNKTDPVIEQGLVSNPFTWSGETNAILINGVGVSVGEKAGTPHCSLPVINVDAGKTYRMRSIGSSALSMVQLAITNHTNFTIVAADGQYTRPYTESYMQVSTGQRFEVIFKAKSAVELGGQTDFLIRFESKDRPTVYHGYGVLRYNNATAQINTGPATPPFALPNATYAWLKYALEPLVPNNFPYRQRSTYTDIWRLNGLQWNTSSSPYPGDKPYFVNIYENGPSAVPNLTAAVDETGGWDPVSLTWPAKLGEVLEIIWYNTGSLVLNNGDIGSGNGTYDVDANEAKLANYTPVLRDTTNLYRYEAQSIANYTTGWRGWRLRVDDPGVWMIHCHTLQHMLMGVQSVWVMGDYEQIARIPWPDAAGYLEYGGNSYRNATYAPSYVHQFQE